MAWKPYPILLMTGAAMMLTVLVGALAGLQAERHFARDSREVLLGGERATEVMTAPELRRLSLHLNGHPAGRITGERLQSLRREVVPFDPKATAVTADDLAFDLCCDALAAADPDERNLHIRE